MDFNTLVKQYDEIPMFRDYVKLVSQYYRSKHHVSEYADMLHKSPKTLVNSFARMGLPKPIEILHGQLTVASIQSIMSSNESIKQLAWDIGYYDLDTFSRCFKRKTGLSPSEFRLQYQGDFNKAMRIIIPEMHSLFIEFLHKEETEN